MQKGATISTLRVRDPKFLVTAKAMFGKNMHSYDHLLSIYEQILPFRTIQIAAKVVVLTRTEEQIGMACANLVWNALTSAQATALAKSLINIVPKQLHMDKGRQRFLLAPDTIEHKLQELAVQLDRGVRRRVNRLPNRSTGLRN